MESVLTLVLASLLNLVCIRPFQDGQTHFWLFAQWTVEAVTIKVKKQLKCWLHDFERSTVWNSHCPHIQSDYVQDLIKMSNIIYIRYIHATACFCKALHVSKSLKMCENIFITKLEMKTHKGYPYLGCKQGKHIAELFINVFLRIRYLMSSSQ